MEDTKHIRISDFDYDLPDGRIAKFPLARRDSSKLLVYRGGRISEDVFSSLPEYIPAGTLMLFNNTKVLLPVAMLGGQSEEVERRSA